MLYKIIIEGQIRLFDCKETLTIEALTAYVKKMMPTIASFDFYYLDEEGDQIILETKEDFTVYLENEEKKPKIYVRKLQPAKEMFDAGESEILETQFKSRSPIIEVEKGEEKKEREIKQKQSSEPMMKEIKKEEIKLKEQDVSKQHYMAHKVKCDSCEAYPIYGIRYKCGICKSFDLCQACITKNKHQINHPFIKIRDSNSAPLDVQLQLKLSNQNERKQSQMNDSKSQKEEKIIEKIPIEIKEVQLKFQTQQQKQMVIISYLESIFGAQGEQNYIQFAKITSQTTEEKICENYLNWLACKDTGMINKVINWVKDKGHSTFKNVKTYFIVHSD